KPCRQDAGATTAAALPWGAADRPGALQGQPPFSDRGRACSRCGWAELCGRLGFDGAPRKRVTVPKTLPRPLALLLLTRRGVRSTISRRSVRKRGAGDSRTAAVPVCAAGGPCGRRLVNNRL